MGGGGNRCHFIGVFEMTNKCILSKGYPVISSTTITRRVVEDRMEKRWSERKELRVAVDVYRQGELLGSCFSHDIGLGGTFLGMDTSFDMRKDADVELIFRLVTDDQSTRHKLHARVTRVSDEGVGFKFCDFDTGVFRSLQEIMAYRRQTKTHPNTHANAH